MTGGKEEFEDEDQEIEVDKLSKNMEEYYMYSRLERKRKREEKGETWREGKLNQKAEIETSIEVLSKNEENGERNSELLKLLQICQVLDKLKQI